MKNSKIEKFKISKISSILTLIICGICILVYIYLINIENIGLATNQIITVEAQRVMNMQKLIKEVLLIVVSILGTNLLLALIIEVKSKNSLYTDLITNDIFACPDFYNNLSDDNKAKIQKNLEAEQFFGSNLVKADMFESIRKKLNEIKKEYYYKSCDYIVDCSIFDDYIEKEIVRTINIYSYNKNATISNFILSSSTTKKIQGLDSFELESITLNAKPINIKDTRIETQPVIDQFHIKNGYDTITNCIYNKNIKVYNNKDTTICIKYKTRVNISDNAYTCRIREHCKEFSLNFSINAKDLYKIHSEAFGFLDTASQTPNSNVENKIIVEFKDWIFDKDGVALHFNKV